MKIGLTLSGGGFRATVFHLGVLARLAEENLLEQVALISTVSGGSLCGGLVFGKNGFRWPTSKQFVEQVVPQARELLTSQDLQFGLFELAIQAPLDLFKPRANLLSKLLQEHWGITARLCDLPPAPRWLINATSYETGKNWRFEANRMGDYVFGYSTETTVPVSDAMASSAGFPGLIGALVFDASRYNWFRYAGATKKVADSLTVDTLGLERQPLPQPMFPTVHLWDGGVYDNFGLEGVLDVEKGWRGDLDFLVISDASGRPHPEAYQMGFNAANRIISGVMMDQIRALRTRSFMERVKNHGDPGILVRTGATCAGMLAGSRHNDEAAKLSGSCLSKQQADAAADFPTVIRSLKPDEFELLFRHGFEVADYTLYGYGPAESKYVSYLDSRWGQTARVGATEYE